MKLAFTTATAALIALYATPAHAYIDPGTGGALASHIGAILAAAATAALTAITILRTAIKSAVAKITQTVTANSATTTFTFLLVITVSAATAIYNYNNNYAMGGQMTEKTKVIVIGIDGFDPDIIEHLMHKGQLPNFKRLATIGTYARMQTMDPPISPVVWTTIATGTDPSYHNIYDFMRFDRKEMLPYLSVIEHKNTITGQQYTPPIKAKPFWETASEAGIKTAVIRWPLTFPAAKINGTMLSGFGTPDVKGYLSGYTLYTDDTDKDTSKDDVKTLTDTPDGKKVATIYGPKKINGKPSEIQMTLQSTKNNSLRITIQNTTFTALPHFWSQWIPLEFKTSITGTIKAQTRLYVAKTTPHIEVFITSIQADPQHPDLPISYPQGHASTIAAQTKQSYYTLGMPEDIKAVNDNNLPLKALLQQAADIHEERAAMFIQAHEQMLKGNISLIAVVFDETDRIEHMTFNNEVIREKGKILSVGPSIENIYTEKDKFLGTVLDQITKDTAIIVISDHGFKPFTKTFNINTWLREQGYLVSKNPPSTSSKPLYKDVIWEKTKAYSYGYTAININIKQREKAGTVKKEQAQQLIAQITEKLKALVDPETGKKIIDKVINTSNTYSGAYSQNAPDIIILPNPPYRVDWESPIGQTTPHSIAQNEKAWKADHMFGAEHVPGIFFSNFKINSQPTVWDIAPTITQLLGQKAPSTYAGKPLTSTQYDAQNKNNDNKMVKR